jgi:hypothetical protein
MYPSNDTPIKLEVTRKSLRKKLEPVAEELVPVRYATVALLSTQGPFDRIFSCVIIKLHVGVDREPTPQRRGNGLELQQRDLIALRAALPSNTETT